MGAPIPAPPEVRAEFDRLRALDAEQAVAYLHGFGAASGYIDEAAVARNIRWTAASPYGELELTINLAKPEKDPRAIAAAAKTKTAFESEGPARAEGLARAIEPARAEDPARAEEPASAGVAAAKGSTISEVPARTTVAASEAATSAMRLVAFSGAPAPALSAPRCDLCWENEGFPGAPGCPAKPGLRIAAIELGGERWGLQFSPYAYFDEHCIALSAEHRPMMIDAAGMERLLDFADLFPFYFVGSNADLPIVGGSILSHDHFQGGRHVFPLMKAPLERDVPLAGLPQVECGIVRWPASTLRLRSLDRAALACAAARILETWRGFSFEPCGIVAHDADGRHSTLNPIVHREGADYVMHLVLRNNRVDAAHPWGIFHPGEELHHIKKENIGLIEIMGLAILPPRLARELPLVERELVEAARAGRAPREAEARLRDREGAALHAAWAADVLARRGGELASRETRLNSCMAELAAFAADDTGPLGRVLRAGATGAGMQPASRDAIHPILREEIARVFAAILETAGVFKRDAAGRAGWDAFLAELERS